MLAAHCNQTAAEARRAEGRRLRARGGSTASSLVKKPPKLAKAAPSFLFGMATAAAAPKGPTRCRRADRPARHDLKMIERGALALIAAELQRGAAAAGTTNSMPPAQAGTRYYTTQARPSAQQQ